MRFYFLLASFLLVFAPQAVFGEAPVIYQTISLGFSPQKSFLLVGGRSGDVQQFPAEFVRTARRAREQGEDIQLLVGARVPERLTEIGEQQIFFTFFLLGEESTFAATPVRGWNGDDLQERAATEEQIRGAMKELEKKIALKREQVSELDRSLETMRDRASSIAGVDDIIDLKMKITRLEGYGQENNAEVERLRKLVERGREQAEPEDIYQRLQELSFHLKEAAQATAMADRLNARRQTAAKLRLRQDLALIREMREQDVTELAQEALKMRSRRRELERDLNVEIVEEDLPF